MALLPVMGAASVLLLEGAEHHALRKAMLPPFHGERMRSYEGIVREVTEREITAGRRKRRSSFTPTCRRSRWR